MPPRDGGGPAAPRGQRPGRAAGGHPPDRGTDAAAAGRGDAGRGDPAGQPARSGRPADRQGPRQARRVRLQDPGHRQRDGVIADYAVEHRGNPADGPQLAPAIRRVIKLTGNKPGTVTADRSYGEQAVEDDLRGLGVRHVVIPRKGKPGKARQAAERRPAFRRTIKWRTGSEGRISALKRGYGWDRTRLDRTEKSPDLGRARSPGPQTWSRSVPLPADASQTRTACRQNRRNSALRLFQVEVARDPGAESRPA